MKKILGSFAAAAVYLVLMCFLLGEDVLLLFDAGLFGMLLLGSIILCLPYLENRGNDCQMKGIFAKNALMTGYIETFMLLFISLQSTSGVRDSLLSRVALDFRPLFYGFIFYLLLGRESEQAEDEPVSEKESKGGEKTEMEEQTGLEEQPGDEGGAAAEEASRKERKTGQWKEQDLSLLSRRERQVAELVKRGLSNREIGEELYISEATVKKHVSHIFEKLGIESRRDLK